MIGIGIGLPFIKSFDSFNPASISDLKVWLKGDSGITLVGGEVDVWADQSGNGNNVSAATAINRPTISTRNGKNVLVFNGSTKWLRRLTSTLLRNVSGYTIFVVANSTRSTAASQVFVAVSTTNDLLGGSRAVLGFDSITGTRLGRDFAGRRLNADSLQQIGQLTYNPDLAVSSARINSALAIAQSYVNNVATDSLNPFQTAGNTPNDGGALFLGVNVTGSFRFLEGQIGEILIYERLLTDSELVQVQNYLAARWA
jgi:hypothetical protein